MAYMVSANMDMGIKEFQIEAAISKIYASVSHPQVLSVSNTFEAAAVRYCQRYSIQAIH